MQVKSVQTVPPGGVLRDSSGAEVDDIGYVQIQEFSRRTAQEVEDAVNDTPRCRHSGPDIDVRFNGGGLLDTTVSLADLFLDNGVI